MYSILLLIPSLGVLAANPALNPGWSSSDTEAEYSRGMTRYYPTNPFTLSIDVPKDLAVEPRNLHSITFDDVPEATAPDLPSSADSSVYI
jgi:hypothetical protein